MRFGAKERTRHAWSTGVDSGVLRGSEQGARRWGRLGVAAHGGGVAGLHQNGDSGLAFERKMIRKRERDKLNRSRAWRRATALRRPGAAARRVCGTLARNLARDRDKPRGKKEARGGSLQPCEAPGTSGRRRMAAPRLLRGGSELWQHSNGGRAARIVFGYTVVGMGFRRGADCAQIGPGAILGVRASGNHGRCCSAGKSDRANGAA